MVPISPTEQVMMVYNSTPLMDIYLPSSLLRRTDDYGGDLHNRAHIIEEIKHRVTDLKFSVSIKIKGGFQPEECREVCKRLEEIGMDWAELSGSTYEELIFRHQKASTIAQEGM